MFLTCCPPMSSKEKSSLSRTCSCAAALMQIPPGSTSASRRAAMSTLSAKDVALFDDDVADIDAHAKFDAPPCRCGVAGDHFALHLDGTAHGINHASEFAKSSTLAS